MADDPLVPIISTLITIYGDLLGDPEAQPLAFMNGRMRHEPEDKAQIDAWLEAVNAFREADAALRRYIKEKNR